MKNGQAKKNNRIECIHEEWQVSGFKMGDNNNNKLFKIKWANKVFIIFYLKKIVSNELFWN